MSDELQEPITDEEKVLATPTEETPAEGEQQLTAEEERRKRREETFYVRDDEFRAALRLYYELAIAAEQYAEDDNSKEAKKARRAAKKQLDVCGIFIYKIAVNYAKKGNFSGYTWIDEMVSDALVKGTKAVVGRKFKLDSPTSPFSYYTTIFHREFTRRIRLENKVVNTRDKYIDEHYKDFAEDCETPVYVKRRFMDGFGELWDDSNA